MLFNKKAVSLIVSYVLLISIGLSIAGLVYGWLRFYVNIEDGVSCPDGVHIAIRNDLSYFDGERNDGSQLSLNLSIQNRGRFNVDGYVIRINNRSGQEIGVHTIYDSRPGGVNQNSLNGTLPLNPGNTTEHKFNSTHLQAHRNICFVQVQPYILDENNNTLPCSEVSSRRITCHPSA